jgi:TonB family protein
MSNTSVQFQSRDSFNKSFGTAFFIHLFLGLLIFGLSHFSIKTDPTLSDKEIYLQSAVRVDIVSMPKLTQKEIKELPLLDAGVVSSPVQEKPTQKVKKVDLSNILSDFSKRRAAPTKKNKKEVEKSNKIDEQRMKQLKGLLLEGNKVSKGTSKLGDSKEVNLSEYNNYVARLPSFVRPNWSLPTYLIQEGLKCRVRIFISKTGKILNKEIYQSSGNEEFDQRALRALQKTQTFPKPDESIQSRLLSGSVILGFPL